MAWGRQRCNVVKDQRFIARLAVRFGSLVAAEHGSTSTPRADAGHECARLSSTSCRFGARARPGSAEALAFGRRRELLLEDMI